MSKMKLRSQRVASTWSKRSQEIDIKTIHTTAISAVENVSEIQIPDIENLCTPPLKRSKSIVVIKEQKTPQKKKRKVKVITSTKEYTSSPPANWEEMLSGIQIMRESRDAEVDTDGCEKFYNDVKYSPEVARFHTLVSAMMSSQTKDPINAAAMRRLQSLKQGLTVHSINEMPEQDFAEIIKPVSFYKTKAKNIKKVASMLLQQHEKLSSASSVDIPRTFEKLVALPGVGPKMAHLVMTVAWNDTVGICVDTHVHRIANRLGWVKSTTPEMTRVMLEAWLPSEHWDEINPLLVGFGQQICGAKTPKCSECLLKAVCPSSTVKRNHAKKVE